MNEQLSDTEFDGLNHLVWAYLHQDMDLEADTVPEEAAIHARVGGEAAGNALRAAMQLFEMRYHNDLEDEFKRRFWFDFDPEQGGLSITEFFDMVRSILVDPEN